ncbi:hypothetical protein D3C72_620240 [compost metagenome]
MQFLQTEHFGGRANETFDLSLGETTQTLTLIEVRPLPIQNFPGMVRQPFSLLFRSPSQIALPQRIYRLNNATIGALDVFLTPVERDAAGVIYEAVFN